jgi:hypothetical protein
MELDPDMERILSDHSNTYGENGHDRNFSFKPTQNHGRQERNGSGSLQPFGRSSFHPRPREFNFAPASRQTTTKFMFPNDIG